MAWIWHCCGSGVGLVVTALFGPLAWEPPCAVGVALKKQKCLQTISALEDVEKKEPYYTVGGNVNWYSHCFPQWLYQFTFPITLLVGM